MLPALFAEEATSQALSGGAGWVGAGLLGLVLMWLLLRHLPDKDRQLKDLLESRDKLMHDQLGLERTSCEKRHGETVAEQRLDRAERERQFLAMMGEFKQVHADDKEVRHAIVGLTNSVNLFTAVARQMMRLPAAGQEPNDRGPSEV